MEYRRGRITQEYRRRGRLARLARFRARSHSRNAYGEGQTGSFPFSEVSSHYEPSESCETNIRKRPVCPRFPSPVPRFPKGVPPGYQRCFSKLRRGHPPSILIPRSCVLTRNNRKAVESLGDHIAANSEEL